LLKSLKRDSEHGWLSHLADDAGIITWLAHVLECCTHFFQQEISQKNTSLHKFQFMFWYKKVISHFSSGFKKTYLSAVLL